MLKPDYHHSIVNLSVSIGAALGAPASDYPVLPELPPESLENRTVILMIVDGLGSRLLDQHQDTLLHRMRVTDITSVLPTTTASAVTAFHLGCATQQHAITGWFTYLAELGCVSAILPFNARARGASLTETGVTPAQVIGGIPLSERINVPTVLISPDYIVNSPYSQALAPGAERHGYRTLEEFMSLTLRMARRSNRQFVIAYWTELDALAHEHGARSARTVHHLYEIDAALERLCGSIPLENCELLITADHGLVDVDAEQVIHLDDHPELAQTLTLPLCGEPRFAYCYVRATHLEQFERYVHQRLRGQVDLWRSRDLVDAGFFGLGKPDPRLDLRIGDFVLIPRKGWIIKDRLISEPRFRQLGVHGGLSEEELFVPFCRAGIQNA